MSAKSANSLLADSGQNGQNSRRGRGATEVNRDFARRQAGKPAHVEPSRLSGGFQQLFLATPRERRRRWEAAWNDSRESDKQVRSFTLRTSRRREAAWSKTK